MRSSRWVVAMACAALMGLAACARDSTPQLLNIRNTTDGPDEFGILPAKGLQLPEDLTALPVPTPGGENLTDPKPFDDAILALGGKPVVAGGIPAADQGLYAHAGRYGTEAGIRQTLAAEDLRFRTRNNGRVLERLFNVNVYFRAYRRQSLDQYAELQRWRRAGVQTPSAPPEQAN